MLDKSKQALQTRQSLPNTSSRLRRGVVAVLLMAACGFIAFFLWALPLLHRFSSSQGASFSTYVVALLPTCAAAIGALIVCLVWYTAVDYGWFGRFSPTQPGERKGLGEADTLVHAKGLVPWKGPRQQEIATEPHVSQRRRLVRATSKEALQERRRKVLYQGRTYRGSVHKEPVPSFPLTMPESKAPTPKEEVVESGSRPSVVASAPSSKEAEGGGPAPAVDRIIIPQPPISIYLLGELIIKVGDASGEKKVVHLRRKRRDDERYTERELLSYLAALRGKPVRRGELLEAVFGYGLPDEKRTPSDLRGQLNKCTQFLRQDINAVAAQLGFPRLSVIGADHDEWFLLIEECRVVDLDEIDTHYAVMDGISGQQFLDESVQEACQALINVYSADFLDHYVEDAVRNGGDEWADNWMRPFYTEYRRKYFLALWYRAEYWRIKGDSCVGTTEKERTEQRNYYELAAQLYRDYALHVSTGYTNESAMMFDLDIEQRVSQGERALRFCLDMFAATGNTQDADAVYRSFVKQMGELTQDEWKPRADTIDALKNVRAQTKAHRRSGIVTPHDPLQQDQIRKNA